MPIYSTEQKEKAVGEPKWPAQPGRATDTYPLLLTATEDVFPLFARVETTFPCRQVGQMNVLEDIEQLSFRATRSNEIRVRVWVNDSACNMSGQCHFPRASRLLSAFALTDP